MALRLAGETNPIRLTTLSCMAALLALLALLTFDAAAHFIRCFAERAPKEPRFADTVRLARSLYDRMPSQ